jgi:magnesium transporter
MTVSPATTSEHQLHIETISHNGLKWVNIERPRPQEIEYLSQNYPFHPLDLDDCLTRNQRPKIDEYDDYLFIILHFPLFRREDRVTTPSEVDIFIGADYVITSHSGELKALSSFFRDCQMEEANRSACMEQGPGFLLYSVLDRLVKYCFPILNKIIANVESVEDNIFNQRALDTVREISVIRRDLIAFRRIMRPQRSVLYSLEQRRRPFLTEEIEVYFSDISDQINKIIDAIDDYKEVLESLADTNDSLTSHRLNDVMRILTIISTLMLPATLLASIYGMNVPLPFQGSEISFALAMMAMLLIATVMLIFFRLKHWI